MTPEGDIRRVLLATMERGTWYSISELDRLARRTISPDAEDLERHDSGELRWGRQIRNALRDFRRGNTGEWNGDQRENSRYRLPEESPNGVSAGHGVPLIDLEDASPPRPAVANDGYEAEIYVQRQWESQGWSVRNVRNLGLGYDLRAERDGEAGAEVRRIEVKSSVSGIVTPELTENEMAAARRFGAEYVLATVDNWDGESGELTEYPDPANQMVATPIYRTTYRLQRS